MTDDLTPPKLLLNPDARPAAVRGRPWIFSNQLRFDARTRALPAGAVVRVAEPSGRVIGLYHFNPRSLIAARLLTRNADRKIDAGFFAERLGRALALRSALFDRPYYRLCHAEGDNLPGLVVDRYADVLVVQPNSAGMMTATDLICDALEQLLKPSAILLSADGPAREQEGLAPVAELARGAATDVRVEENGVVFAVDPLGGQKTGWFYDHRANRAFAARLAQGRSMLDLYTYAGGFGLAAARAGAARVTLVDRSAQSLALAGQSAQANGLAAVECVDADVFGWLDAGPERRDIVVADPPAFAKTRKDVPAALKGYAKLARLAATAVADQGFLCLASCSHHVTAENFLDVCADGIRAAGRAARLVHAAAAGPDHPVHPQLPQTAYLKFLAFALD